MPEPACIREIEQIEIDPIDFGYDTREYSGGSRRGGQTVEISIYQSRQNYDANGYEPAIAIAEFVHNDLLGHDLNHRITFGHDPVDPPSEFSMCERTAAEALCTCEAEAAHGVSEASHVATEAEPIDWWNDLVDAEGGATGGNVLPVISKDSNILCVEFQGGGCAYVNGNAGVTGMAGVSFVRDLYSGGSDSYSYRIWTAMHEIGHNMGAAHADNGSIAVEPGDGYLHTTPTFGRIEQTGWCGQSLPEWGGSPPRWFELSYSDCHIDNCRIE